MRQLGVVVGLFMLSYSVWLTIWPDRFVAFQVWQYRKVFGARVADPDRFSVTLYRTVGIVLIPVSIFILYQFLSE